MFNVRYQTADGYSWRTITDPDDLTRFQAFATGQEAVDRAKDLLRCGFLAVKVVHALSDEVYYEQCAATGAERFLTWARKVSGGKWRLCEEVEGHAAGADQWRPVSDVALASLLKRWKEERR